MSVQINGDNVFTKEMANVFETEVIECPDCGFEFGCKHEQANEAGIYVCPACRECNLEVEIEKLKEQLQAKVTLINNGWEEERYVLQEKNDRLKTFTQVEKVVVYDNGVSEICYEDGENMLVNHVMYSNVHLSGWEDEDCFLKKSLNQEIQKKKYYVRVQGEDAFLTDVYWSVYLSNNPSFDEILCEWIYENFGDKEFEYECLSDIETKETGVIGY